MFRKIYIINWGIIYKIDYKIRDYFPGTNNQNDMSKTVDKIVDH